MQEGKPFIFFQLLGASVMGIGVVGFAVTPPRVGSERKRSLCSLSCPCQAVGRDIWWRAQHLLVQETMGLPGSFAFFIAQGPNSPFTIFPSVFEEEKFKVTKYHILGSFGHTQLQKNAHGRSRPRRRPTANISLPLCVCVHCVQYRRQAAVHPSRSTTGH